MFCGKCGKEIKDGIKFCNNCGAPISSKDENNVAHKIKNSTKNFVTEIVTNRENVKKKVKNSTKSFVTEVVTNPKSIKTKIKNNKKVIIVIVAIFLVIMVGHKTLTKDNRIKKTDTSQKISDSQVKDNTTNNMLGEEDVVLGCALQLFKDQFQTGATLPVIDTKEIMEKDNYGRYLCAFKRKGGYNSSGKFEFTKIYYLIFYDVDFKKGTYRYIPGKCFFTNENYTKDDVKRFCAWNTPI